MLVVGPTRKYVWGPTSNYFWGPTNETLQTNKAICVRTYLSVFLATNKQVFVEPLFKELAWTYASVLMGPYRPVLITGRVQLWADEILDFWPSDLLDHFTWQIPYKMKMKFCLNTLEEPIVYLVTLYHAVSFDKRSISLSQGLVWQNQI